MSATTSLQSWGRYPRAEQEVFPLFWSTETPPFDSLRGPVLPYGRGRSYGDVCLNDGGTLLTTARMDHFLAFDPDTGRLRCEAGTGLDQILDLIVPRRWFLPGYPRHEVYHRGWCACQRHPWKEPSSDGDVRRACLRLRAVAFRRQ